MKRDERRDVLASPYRGLHPFRYVDRDYFFGREETIIDLLAKVLISRLMLLFGESGTGKSSVINAGLIPALEKEGLRPERLRVRRDLDEPIEIEKIPIGDDERGPFLPSIFFDYSAMVTDAGERSVPCSLERFLKTIRKTDAHPVLIFDQFEELFTLFAQDDNKATEEALRDDILKAIFEIINDNSLKARVIIIVREDFLGKLEILAKDYPKVFDHRMRLQHLDQDSTVKAIVGPFEDPNRFQSRLTIDLAEKIVQELAHERENVPIHSTELQIVCSRLWDKYAPTKPEITVKEFEELGEVKGIIEGFLESELAGIEPALRSQAVEVLGHLITEAGTRDVVSEDRLLRGLTGLEKDTGRDILKYLEKRRLVYGTARRGTYYYELANEYLIQPIKKECEQLALKRERDEAEKQLKLEHQRRWKLAGLILVLVVMVGLAVYAFQQKEIAEAKHRKSTSGELAMTAINNLEIDPELSTLLAVQAVSTTYSKDKTVTDKAEDALHRAVQALCTQQLTFSGHTAAIFGVAFSPDGKRLATASADKTAKVWDAVDGTEVFTMTHNDWVYSVAFSPECVSPPEAPAERCLATASQDGTATVWDADSGQELLTLSGHTGAVRDVTFSPDGRRLATASADGTAKVWDAVDGTEVFTLTGHIDVVFGVAFSPDGTRLATASRDWTTKVWDTTSGQELFSLSGHADDVLGVAFSPDGTRLITASRDGTTRVWDSTSGRELFTLSRHTEAVQDIALSPDGKRLATASADRTVRVYVLDIEELLTLAKQLVPRPLRLEECQKYLHLEQCPSIP